MILLCFPACVGLGYKFVSDLVNITEEELSKIVTACGLKIGTARLFRDRINTFDDAGAGEWCQV